MTSSVEFDVKPPSKQSVFALLRNLKLVAIRRKRTVAKPSLPALVLFTFVGSQSAGWSPPQLCPRLLTESWKGNRDKSTPT